MLEFEHLVQVNDPADERFNDLSRTQLWQGLVLRARFPQKFNQGLDCQSEALENNEFLRTIAAGESSFLERVRLTPEKEIHTQTVPGEGEDQLQAESRTTIEEPEQGYLFVRFRYRRELLDNSEQVDIAEHLKSAYVQVDRDAIAMIRVLAASELFDQSIN